MSLFENRKRRREAAQAQRPLFRIVGAPNPPATPAKPAPAAAKPARRTITPADYGLLPRDQFRTDRACADPELDALMESVRAGDWQAVSAVFEAVGSAWERRNQLVNIVGTHAVDEADWLDRWLAERPTDPTALVIHQRALSLLAHKLRGSGWAKDLTQQQIQGHQRVMQQVPEAFERATAASAPEDPTPYAVMLFPAMSLGWSHDEFRALWAEVTKRAPHLVVAHVTAAMYWLPRWYGSTELVTAFVEQAAREAPAGSLLTMPRLRVLHDENELLSGDECEQSYRMPAVQAAIEEALADLAAADPAHPRYAHQQHWLAYFLTKVGRFAEAVDFFRQIGGYCDADPWTRYKDPLQGFAGVRAQAVLGWEDAGRPPLPGRADQGEQAGPSEQAG